VSAGVDAGQEGRVNLLQAKSIKMCI